MKSMIYLLVIFSLFILFVWASSIHKIVDHGKAYGFTIGMSKEEVITALHTKSEMTIRKINLVKADKSSKLIALSSLNNNFDNGTKWVVMYDSAFFFNSVTLEFCDESLCEIFRNRHYLEYP